MGFEKSYITKYPILLDHLNSHCAIETQLHWVFDVTMREDASTIRKDIAPEDLSLLRRVVLNFLRMDTSGQRKASLRLKRRRAALAGELCPHHPRLHTDLMFECGSSGAMSSPVPQTDH